MSLEEIGLKYILKNNNKKLIDSIPFTTLFNILNKIDNGIIKLRNIELAQLLYRITEIENCKSSERLHDLINKLYVKLSLSPSTSLYVPNDPELLIERIIELYKKRIPVPFSKDEVIDIINYLSEVFEEYVTNTYIILLNKTTNTNTFTLTQSFTGNAQLQGVEIPFSYCNLHLDSGIEETRKTGSISFNDAECDVSMFDILVSLNNEEHEKIMHGFNNKNFLKLSNEEIKRELRRR